ncbi:MAG: trypsin-like serine protease [Symploca sp. SIO1B1]|nr:trypsin-like serine protease [Symploca sp. SIO1B1]
MNLKAIRKCLPFSTAALVAVFPNSLLAQQVPVSKENTAVTTNSASDPVTAYWTPERMANAQSLDLPQAALAPSTSSTTEPTLRSVSGEGKPPIVNLTPDANPLFTPPTPNYSEVVPNNVGTSRAYFTSSRIVPLTADRAYPYRAVGKLFFTDNGRNAVCSASVIGPRIILTAGHCVHRGSGGSNGFFSNFVFVPSYRDGTAPYRRWTWRSVVTTGEWASSNNRVPNSADFAIIEVNDQFVNGRIRRIGDITGYLGYRTQRLIPNHATLLGYPGNLDNGQKMHQVTAESFRTNGSNTVIYGSDMRGGSSGGPWVQNFGVAALGQTNGLEQGQNQVIGVTSYGRVSIGPLYQGSSILNSSFISILNTACARRPDNC